MTLVPSTLAIAALALLFILGASLKYPQSIQRLQLRPRELLGRALHLFPKVQKSQKAQTVTM
jgi:hypothetical protein